MITPYGIPEEDSAGVLTILDIGAKVIGLATRRFSGVLSDGHHSCATNQIRRTLPFLRPSPRKIGITVYPEAVGGIELVRFHSAMPTGHRPRQNPPTDVVEYTAGNPANRTPDGAPPQRRTRHQTGLRSRRVGAFPSAQEPWSKIRNISMEYFLFAERIH